MFALIGAILLLAASLMVWLYPPQSWTDDRVPNPLRQDLTALSNAAEELRLLTELEQRQPDLAELVELGITPFAPTHKAIACRSCGSSSITVSSAQYRPWNCPIKCAYLCRLPVTHHLTE